MTLTGIIEESIELPSGVTAGLREYVLTVKGPKGELARRFYYPKIKMTAKDGIQLSSEFPRRAEKALLGTWKAHVTNMIRGVTDGYEYNMKIVYAHFPIKTSIRSTEDGKEFIIENFLGERFPRKARIMGETEVKVSGDQVILTGIDKEHVGQSAANIELATKIKRYDLRVFQDGIYIVKKG
jgi:large subunit ribosomal protein L6